MTRYRSSSAFWFMFFGFVAFWPLFYGLGYDAMTELSSSLVLGAAVAIALTWGSAAFSSFRSGMKSGEDLLSLGIFCLAGSIAVQRIWIIVFRWAGRPDWMLLSPVSAFTAWSIFSACALVLLAPGTISGSVPQRNWIYVMGAVATGALIAGITIGFYVASSQI